MSNDPDLGNRPGDSSISESLAVLDARRRELKKIHAKRQRNYYLILAASVLMLVPSPVFALVAKDRRELQFIAPTLLIYGVPPLALAPLFRIRLRDAEADLQDIDFQIDLQQFDVSKEEHRAEKILRINEVQLRRYYDMNLSQNLWVFSIGVLCIVLGIVVIAVSLYLVRHTPDKDGKVIVASLGAVGSILANFVAAIYLRMNASASKNLADFHSRLVDTHQILLANLLASRIHDDEKRWHTLAELATGLTAVGRNPAIKSGEPGA